MSILNATSVGVGNCIFAIAAVDEFDIWYEPLPYVSILNATSVGVGDCIIAIAAVDEFDIGYEPLPYVPLPYVPLDVYMQVLLDCASCMDLNVRFHPYAQYYFAAFLFKKKGQYKMALALLKEAAEKGHNESLYAMIDFFENGLGVSKDHKAAEGIRKQCWERGVFGWEHTHEWLNPK